VSSQDRAYPQPELAAAPPLAADRAAGPAPAAEAAAIVVLEPDLLLARRLMDGIAEAAPGSYSLSRAASPAELAEAVAGRAPRAVVLSLGVHEEAEKLALELASRAPNVAVLALVPGPRPAAGRRPLVTTGHERLELDALGPAELRLVERALDHALERRRLAAELESARRLSLHFAHHDTLTGLPNRELFAARLRELIARSRRQPTDLAVAFIDLDRFKHINDTLGHAMGDQLLGQVGGRLRGCLRETDTAARRGGDEFTLILPGIARGQDANKVARKILGVLSKPYMVDGHELFVSASLGIALFPADGTDAESLIKHADIAMYRAKARGGGIYQFYVPELGEKALDRIELETSLHQAIEREQFVLHYQPQFDLRTEAVVGMEALVRWQHPDLGTIGPDEFVPVAEETGLIVQLGEWVLEEACRQACEWAAQGLPAVPVAVNFSARQFQFRQPVERVRKGLSRTGLDPARLEIELTESAVMKDPSSAIETLRALREMGIGVSIDDFGTGHSSLAYLKRFPITKLKIDKTFVRTLLVDPKDAAITRAIVGMAHSLELRAVAEGVETGEQLGFLREAGCDELQGYLFSRPLPADKAAALLATANAS
jgi:diguanylate cyclase (GGDEF)-like protein